MRLSVRVFVGTKQSWLTKWTFYGKHVLDFSKRANIAEFVVLCTLSGISERPGEGLGELSYVHMYL